MMVKSMVNRIRKFILKFLGLLEEPIEKIETQEETDEDKFTYSLLNKKKSYITDKLYVRVPTVGEVLKNEQLYYSLVTALTSSPYQYMVQLDDMGIDYTEISDYDFFLIMFMYHRMDDMSLIFGDVDVSNYDICYDHNNQLKILCNGISNDDFVINEFTYNLIADTLRKINCFEKCKYEPGNEHAKKYLIEKERRKLKRKAKKPYEPYLEKLVIALVNTPEFPYNYDQCMDLSLYRFNQSFKQIQHKINFDNVMIGVYAGTVDTSKITNKECLSWLNIKQ